MKHWLLLLAFGCGGLADDPEPIGVVPQDVTTWRERYWCCLDEHDGKPALQCGIELRPDDGMCYCAGIADTESGTCRKTLPYSPGMMCGQSNLVCW